MSNDYKNILLTVKNGEEINKVFVQTSAHNVIVDKVTGETLKQRLAKIAKQLGDQGLTVTEQVQEVKKQIEDLIGNAPEALDSIHEIAKFVQDHQEQYEAIKVVADGIDEAIAGVVGDLGEQATVVDFVNAQIEAAKAAEEARCAAAIAAEAAAREAADGALATAIGENTAAIEAEVQRAQDAEAELGKMFHVFESAEVFDPEAFNGLACIFMPDDPVEAASEADLIEAVAGENKNVVLTSDIEVENNIDLSGLNIEADGFMISGKTQDVVITL